VKFLCDECVDQPIVDALRVAGHEVSYVAEMSPGISDDEVLAIAAADSAVLVTVDKDFGDLVFRQGRAHHGVVLVRLHGIDPAEKARIALAALAEHVDDLAGAFTVIEKDRLRIRRSRTT
jgi:predicted nuclease of predicted toxin-antitoxin system